MTENMKRKCYVDYIFTKSSRSYKKLVSRTFKPRM